MMPVALTIVAANLCCHVVAVDATVVLRERPDLPPFAVLTCADSTQAYDLAVLLNGAAPAESEQYANEQGARRDLARKSAYETQELALAIGKVTDGTDLKYAVHGMTARIVALGDILQDALDLNDDPESCLPLDTLQRRYEGRQ